MNRNETEFWTDSKLLKTWWPDGIEPPPPAFSGLRSPIAQRVVVCLIGTLCVPYFAGRARALHIECIWAGRQPEDDLFEPTNSTLVFPLTVLAAFFPVSKSRREYSDN